MKCKLVVESKGEPMAFEFDQDEITLGRVMDNDIMINDKSVSRYHVKILLHQDQVEIVDLESSNGTELNGKKISRALLHDQDMLHIGNIPVQFICPEAGSESLLDQTMLSSGKKVQVKKIHDFLKRDK
ncbi:MAG: FHA domain-containing protein [Nitrospiraceae bacterium]|nr:MAG: FHA domain-containing protein [Nitrospiraceae bacterium]